MTLSELKDKEVVNVSSGQKIGYVCDCEISVEDGRVTMLIVPGRLRFFGLFGREDDYVVPWEKISIIGDDLVLVDAEVQRRSRKQRKVGR